MSKHSNLFLGSLLAATALAHVAPVYAQTAASPAVQSGTADAIRVLLEQAAYWRSKYEARLADEALNRVLSLDPRNADALAMQAQSAADRGDGPGARVALGKLQAVRPDDPRIQSIQQAMQIGSIDPAVLAEARRLAQDGKNAEAIAAYRRAFRGDTPPLLLAVEFYQTLAAIQGNFDQAKDGLAGAVRANPQDLKAQLAYAQLLTFRQETRDEGIDRLERLTRSPSIAADADVALRQALIWLPVNRTNVPRYQAYLARHPGEEDIQQRVALANTDGGGERMTGFDDLEANRLASAEAHFRKALEGNANDSDAMIGLALIRFKQNRRPEGRDLIRKAIALDPDKAPQYESMLVDAPATGRGAGGGDGGASARRVQAQWAQVTALSKRGEFAAAEALLRRLMGARPNSGVYLLLGDLQTRGGKLADAESTYRSILRGQPRNVAALSGLAAVLTREGKTTEAEAIFSQAQATGGGQAIGQSRAQLLRQQALATSDVEARVGLLRAAVTADPANPWLRLELARVLAGENRTADARQVMAPVLDAPRPSVDQLRAAIYYTSGVHDDRLAASLVSRLPAAAQTPDMRGIQQRAESAAELQEARSLGSVPAMRQRMIQLAARPDPTGIRASTYAQELVRQGDPAGAREVVRAALAASQPVLPQQRLAYASALVGAGYPRDAQILSAGLQADRLNPAQRTQLAEVQDGAAVSAADALNGRGRAADAYDQLAPRLAREPDNPDLNLALARLYAAQNQPRRAVAITDDLLRRNPNSLNVQVAAISAALQAGDTGRAAQLAAQAKAQFPDEPQAFVAAAQVERARGENGQALSDLRSARALRAKQIGTSQSSDATDGINPRRAGVV